MTNLLCKVLLLAATNWFTVSRTTSVDPPGDTLNAFVHFTTDNQVGIVTTNVYARLVWKGSTNMFLLETGPEVRRLERSVSVPPPNLGVIPCLSPTITGVINQGYTPRIITTNNGYETILVRP